VKFSINSIYRATEGEGIWLGSPQVFIRFQGCLVGCLNCDSKDTWDFSDKYLVDFSHIIESVKKESHNGLIKRISITGGDPLHPKLKEQVLEIVNYYKGLGYWINIEAAGTRVDDDIFSKLDFISYDIKTPSTGVKTSTALIHKMFDHYSGKFQLKAVVENSQDFDYLYDLYRKVKRKEVSWVITPAYNLNEDFPEKRFLEIMNLNEKCGGPFRVIGQQHKFLHGPNLKNI